MAISGMQSIIHFIIDIQKNLIKGFTYPTQLFIKYIIISTFLRHWSNINRVNGARSEYRSSEDGIVTSEIFLRKQ